MSLKERIMLEELEGEKLLTRGFFHELDQKDSKESKKLETKEAKSVED
jgi:hypothetical protein